LVEDHPIDLRQPSRAAYLKEAWRRNSQDMGQRNLRDAEKLDKGFVVKINGKKLNGTYVLFKFKPPKNWLLFRKKE